MPDYQFTMLNNYDRWGWSYVMYGNSISADPNTALAVFTPDLIISWQACHNNFVTLAAIRAVNLDDPRRAVTRDYVNIYGIAGAEAAHPAFAIKLGFTTASGQKRTMAMRGLPEAWPQIDGATGNAELPPDAYSAINAWGSSLIASQFAVRKALDQVDHPFFGISSINTSVTPLGQTLLGVEAGHDIDVGDQVYIGQVTDPRFCNMNGYWKVLNVAGDFVTINRVLETGPAYPAYLTSGHIRVIEKALDLFTSRVIKGVSTRNTGRPFGLSRGRSSGGSCRR